jgi:small subunit ribosomal protein S6
VVETIRAHAPLEACSSVAERIRRRIAEAKLTRQSKGAEPGHVDYWGKRRFAYEINHRTEGYYVVLQAKAEPEAMQELHRVLSLADEVVRHKVLQIPERVYGPPKTASAGATDA